MKFKAYYESQTNYLPPETTKKVERAIRRLGGKVWVVGGAVRDAINPESPPSKDVDLVVTNLPIKDPDRALEAIVAALRPIAKHVDVVGQSFGVVNAVVDGEDLDIALPREKETKTGDRHKDFTVQLDPTASIEDDLARRDLTINAMASSLDGSTIIDPFGGQKDIHNKIIRAVGNPIARFSEDPLRMLRAIQFASRFGFTIDDETLEAIKKNAHTLEGEAGERFMGELQKGLSKGKADSSVMADLLQSTGVGKWFGEDFDPINITYDGPDGLPVKIVALFFNGGDMNKAKIPTELQDYVRLARDFAGPTLPFEYVGKHKDKVDTIANFFKAASNEKLASKASKATNVAVTPKDLAISGQDLMNAGLKGKQIGEIMREMLQLIWLGKLENTPEGLSEFVKSKIA